MPWFRRKLVYWFLALAPLLGIEPETPEKDLRPSVFPARLFSRTFSLSPRVFLPLLSSRWREERWRGTSASAENLSILIPRHKLFPSLSEKKICNFVSPLCGPTPTFVLEKMAPEWVDAGLQPPPAHLFNGRLVKFWGEKWGMCHVWGGLCSDLYHLI